MTDRADRATLDSRMSVILTGLCSVFAAALAGASTQSLPLAVAAGALFFGWMGTALLIWQGNHRLGLPLMIVLGIVSIAVALAARSGGLQTSPLLVLAPMTLVQASMMRLRSRDPR